MFSLAGVFIDLEWTREHQSTIYSVNVTPHVNISFVASTRVQLTMPYNTPHNVSVTASLCNEHNTTTLYDLLYGKLLASNQHLTYKYKYTEYQQDVVTHCWKWLILL